MEQNLIKSIKDQKEIRTQSILGGFVTMEKAHVKAHTRKTKSGKLSQVKDYEDKRSKKNSSKESFKKFVKNGGLKIDIPINPKTDKNFKKNDKVYWISETDGTRKEGIIVRRDTPFNYLIKTDDGLWSIKNHKVKFSKIGRAHV